MRPVWVLTALALMACGPSRATSPPTRRAEPNERSRVTRPRSQPPVRKVARPRPRPKRWTAQRLDRVKATDGGAGTVIALRAAGTTLVSVTREARKTWLRGWDGKSRKVLWKLEAPARRVELALAADGMSMVVTTPGGTNHIYQLAGGKPKPYRKWKRKRGRNKGRTQGLSADGSMLIRGDVRGSVRGYELASYKMKWLVKGERVVLSRDGKSAAVIRGTSMQSLDAVTGHKQGISIQASKVWVNVAIHSAKHGAWIVGGAGKCWLWSLPKPRSLPCLQKSQLVWSPGATWMGQSGKGEARILRARDARVALVFKSSAQALLRLTFSSDDSFVLGNETAGHLSFYRLVKR